MTELRALSSLEAKDSCNVVLQCCMILYLSTFTVNQHAPFHQSLDWLVVRVGYPCSI